MRPLRVAFLGTPDFAVPTLDAIVAAGHEVVLVVAQPDRPVGRGQQMTAPPVAARAKALGLALSQPEKLKSGPFPDEWAALDLDVAVVIAYGRILPKAMLDAPRLGCVNVHASLLPRWRGAAPIQAAVRAGDPITGVCTQRMAEGLDVGPVYLERQTPIDAHETAGELHDRLSALSAEIAVATLAGLESIEPVPQDESLATWASKIAKEDGVVDWSRSAIDLDRQVRAFTPWPGGQAPSSVGMIKLLKVHPAPGQGAPGTILSTSPLTVACGEGALVLDQIVAPGKKAVSGTDYANGARLAAGGTL